MLAPHTHTHTLGYGSPENKIAHPNFLGVANIVYCNLVKCVVVGVGGGRRRGGVSRVKGDKRQYGKVGRRVRLQDASARCHQSMALAVTL